jgi:hypothetical protein
MEVVVTIRLYEYMELGTQYKKDKEIVTDVMALI